MRDDKYDALSKTIAHIIWCHLAWPVAKDAPTTEPIVVQSFHYTKILLELRLTVSVSYSLLHFAQYTFIQTDDAGDSICEIARRM